MHTRLRSPEPPAPRLGALISAHVAQAPSLRRAWLLLGFAFLVFVVLIPFARIRLGVQAAFLPVVQTILVVNDVATASLLFAQVHATRGRPLLVVACGYAFAAAMAILHLASFPGAFAPAGLLGGNAQTTAFLYIFWHSGFAVALLAYAVLRGRETQRAAAAAPLRVGRALAVTAVSVALLAAYATLGSAWLPPLLDGDTYSSGFHVARFGQWILTAAAMAALWRLRRRTILEAWLLVVLANQFVEIGLVAVFNSGRYDLGFYCGRIFALVASSLVLGILFFEQAKLYAQLLAAEETARSELQLREAGEVLRRSLLAGGMGAWSVELATGRVWWSPELEAAAGWRPEGQSRTREACLRRVHADDVPALRRAYRRALVTRSDFALEFRFLAANGHWRWLSGRGRVEADATGRPVKIFGSAMDVTERKQSEVARRELEAGLRSIAEDLPVMAWMARPDGSVAWYNRRWQQYTGIGPHRPMATAWQSAAHPEALPQLVGELEAMLRSERPFERIVHWRAAAGSYRPFLTRCVPIRGGDGAVLYWLATSTDVSEQHSTELALRRADRDKDALLATVARELRAPLLVLQDAVASATRLPDMPAGALSLHRLMDRQVRLLQRLAEDMVDAGLLAQARLALKRERTSLADTLVAAVDAVRPLDGASGPRIHLDAGGEEIVLLADARRLRQAWANLLMHAIAWAAPGGQVSIASRREDAEAIVTLRLAGEAAGPHALQRLFVAFAQCPVEGEGGQAGPGLGLALAKALVAAHGGTICVQAGSQWGGIEIAVALPVEGDGGRQAEPLPALQVERRARLG